MKLFLCHFPVQRPENYKGRNISSPKQNKKKKKNRSKFVV
jgi:hypothetical protein